MSQAGSSLLGFAPSRESVWSKCATAAESSWVLADSVDWSWLYKASHSDSSWVTFDTIRFCLIALIVDNQRATS